MSPPAIFGGVEKIFFRPLTKFAHQCCRRRMQKREKWPEAVLRLMSIQAVDPALVFLPSNSALPLASSLKFLIHPNFLQSLRWHPKLIA